MRGRPFSTFTILSLLLFVAVVVMWVLSYGYMVRLVRYSHPSDGAPLQTHSICTFRGLLLIHVESWGRGGDKGVTYQLVHHSHDFGGGGMVQPDRMYFGFGHSFELTPPDMVDSAYHVVLISL